MMERVTGWLTRVWRFIAKPSRAVYFFLVLPVARYVNKREWLKTLLVFAAFFAVFCAMYFSVNTLVSSDDHFFHFRFAEEIRTVGFSHAFNDFKSIYFTKIAQGDQYYIYYNFLFYLVILPLTFIQPLVLAIKLYAVIAAALSFAVFYWCLKRFNVRYPFLWVLIILAMTSLTPVFRLFLSRPYALTPALLMLLLYFLHKKNRWGVFLISFGYLFWHGATFFLPLGVAVAYYLFERFYGGKGDWKNLALSAGGTLGAVGIVYALTPGFFLYIQDNIWGVFRDVIVGKSVNIAEGGELYPTDFFNFVRTNTYIFATLLVVAGVEASRYVRYKREGIEAAGSYSYESNVLRTTLFFLCIGILLSVFVVSARFNDYFAAFVGLYIAISFDDIKRFVSVSDAYVKKGLAVGGLVAVLYLCFSNGLNLYQLFGNGAQPDEWRKVGEWLDMNTKPGDIVFNANWSWFTELYYYAPQDDYIIGLEPRLTYVYSPSLYWLWWHIGVDGYVCDTEKCDAQQSAKTAALRGTPAEQKKWYVAQGNAVANILLDDFHSKYLVSSNDYVSLEYVLDNSKRFKRVLTDQTRYTPRGRSDFDSVEMTISMKLSVVIPVFNEKGTLPEILDRIAAVDLVGGLEKEVVIVDDFSKEEVVLPPGHANHPTTVYKVVRHEENRGKGAAVRTGLGEVSGDFVVIQDADLEYDPTDYNKLLPSLLSGEADIVYGSRFEHGRPRGMALQNYLANRALTAFSNLMTGLAISDMETCYKMMTRKVASHVSSKLTSDRFGIEPEITALVKRMKVEEVPVSYVGRTAKEGKKIGWFDGLEAVWKIVKFNL